MLKTAARRSFPVLPENLAYYDGVRLDKEIRKIGEGLLRAVNHNLRLGFSIRSRPNPVKPFVVRARPLGLPPGLSYDNVEELIEQLEGPLHN